MQSNSAEVLVQVFHAWHVIFVFSFKKIKVFAR